MSNNENIHQYDITVTGEVQGVNYRASAQETARELGVTGWITNQPDGSVRIVATGTPVQLQAMVAWCRKGPLGADVADVRWEEHAPQHFEDFAIRR